jgi:hypothetical protein
LPNAAVLHLPVESGNFNKIFNENNPQSIKYDTDMLKDRDPKKDNSRFKRIYQICNVDGKKTFQEVAGHLMLTLFK